VCIMGNDHMTQTDSGVIDRVKDVTLQINLCAADLAYARQTVPELVAAHNPAIRRLAIVDCCRPQRTRIFDPDSRQSAGEFERRVVELRRLAESFKEGGLFHEITYLEPGDARFRSFAGRYARPWMLETHDYGGCAFMPYWAAMELPRTRFVIHYDSDILLHQDPGFSWPDDALALWARQTRAVAAVPRTSPPGFAASPTEDAPTLHEGRPKVPTEGGWFNDWFSTRCFFLDRARLGALLPLVGPFGSVILRLRRLINRGYPPAPELLLFRSLGKRGWRCLNLSSNRAWLLHPTRKDNEYIRLLPGIIESVKTGRVPESQRGYADLKLDAWSAFLPGTSPS
jgi:hypothetical protein